MSRTRRAASGIARPEAARCDDGQCPRASRGVRRVCRQATAALQGSGAKNGGCAVSYDLLPARGPIGRAQHPIYLRLRKPSLRRWRAWRDNMPHIRKNLHLATCAPPPTGPGWAGFASPVVAESPRTPVLRLDGPRPESPTKPHLPVPTSRADARTFPEKLPASENSGGIA